jgi:hypothetical protein
MVLQLSVKASFPIKILCISYRTTHLMHSRHTRKNSRRQDFLTIFTSTGLEGRRLADLVARRQEMIAVDDRNVLPAVFLIGRSVIV